MSFKKTVFTNATNILNHVNVLNIQDTICGQLNWSIYYVDKYLTATGFVMEKKPQMISTDLTNQ